MKISPHFPGLIFYLYFNITSISVIFKDIPIAKQILASNNPKQHKALGRKVKNFDGGVWSGAAKVAVKTGNMAKVSATHDFLFQKGSSLISSFLAWK